ncbi:MAG TPA: hypothetical protein VMR52_12860 [Dehalococcoidia bacterium]|nr:hypothetical protein [Dehalococcoidia bacterium]
MSVTKELRFAMDEKGMKTLAPTLVGQTISYWEDDRDLRRGLVKAADVVRDRYGNPFIEVDIEEGATGAKEAPLPPAA